MNIQDFDVKIPEGDKLEILFNRQRDLIDKYHPIEQTNVGHHIPSAHVIRGEGLNKYIWQHAGALDTQDRASQLRMKSFAWRVTEELTEATLCFDEAEFNEPHYLEELIDALHFTVELCCYSGVTEKDILGGAPNELDMLDVLFKYSDAEPFSSFTDLICQAGLRSLAYSVVETIGEAMNRLKLKEWKSTAILTDEKLYHDSIRRAFLALIDLLKASGLTSLTTMQLYLNKNAVNQFRVNTNY